MRISHNYFRSIATSFSVAAIVSLSIWHAFNFYYQRINEPRPRVETVKIELVAINAYANANSPSQTRSKGTQP